MITGIKKEKPKSESSIARLKKDNEIFEILVDCKEAIALRKGEGSVEKALMVDEIFKDARTGDKHGELTKYFGTDDVYKIADEIIKKGDVQLTASYRNELLEQKTKQIINELVKRATDPTTNLPIPPMRLELGLKKAGVKIDYDKSVNDQLDEIIKKLSEYMPIKMSEASVRIVLKPQQIAKCYGVIKRQSTIVKQDYLPDGSTIILITMPAGLKQGLINELNSLTQGAVMIEEVK